MTTKTLIIWNIIRDFCNSVFTTTYTPSNFIHIRHKIHDKSHFSWLVKMDFQDYLDVFRILYISTNFDFQFRQLFLNIFQCSRCFYVVRSFYWHITKTMTPFLINIEIISGMEIFILDGETRVNNEPKIYQRFLMFHTLILCKKCPYPGFSWSVFSRIRIEYETDFVFLRIQSECGKTRTRKTSNTDAFYAL